ncbi:MAG: 50S ribosomal protein L18 [Patescibacteria group bacterium]|jgi:large subunit ribosomal protein L18
MANVRNKIKKINSANQNLPRLIVVRSNKNMYAQIVDSETGNVLVAVSTLKAGDGKLTDMARKVGEEIAKKAAEKKVKSVVLDRSEYRYHGAVKELVEAAKKSGLNI